MASLGTSTEGKAAALIHEYGWYEWLVHTNFSFMVGASHPHEYVDGALQLGYRGFAVTDYDGVYGLPRAYRALKERRSTSLISSTSSVEQERRGISKQRAADLKLFYGAELHLEPDHQEPICLQNTIVLIAKSFTGYGNLCAILSFQHRRGKRDSYITMDELQRFPLDDLAVLIPMRGSIRWGAETRLETSLQRLKVKTEGSVYLVVSRHGHPSEDCWIPERIRFAQRLELPLLFSQDVFFHASHNKDLSDVLHSVRLNQPIGDIVNQLFVNGERSFHSLEALARSYGNLEAIAGVSNQNRLSLLEIALQNSRRLADSIHFELTELTYHYPKEMLPCGYTAQSYLVEMSWVAAKRVFGEPLPDKIVDNLNHELSLIAELQFADYFLTVGDIVTWARGQGILCQGRGSAANSTVCFVLGITSVNPNTLDLLFERFISSERGDPPDIDVDFEHERREEVIQYIYERYGRDKAAMVANVVTFRGRGSIRSVGKALGFPEVYLKQAARILDQRQFRHNATIETIQKVKEEFGAKDSALTQQSATLPWRQWASLSQRIKGFPQHLGIHSGGFVISDLPLDRLVAQEPATMPGRSIIQWCKEDIEALGFFKVDILALGMLTAIRRTFDMLQSHHNCPLDLATIPQDDPPTYQMIQRADTVGVFQIESRAQMSMLPRLKPNSFYDLVIEVAIIRPGPIQGGMIHPYLRRRNKEEDVIFPDPRLAKILERTLGIPIFQEQVMRIAIAVGGFSAGEADELRRHMGAWSIKGDLTPFIAKLYDGMLKNGLSPEFADRLIKQMRGFADYGFPESHSASFALLAYASSYLKCHYPSAFFAALLNSQPMGFYPPHVLLQTARRDGVRILPVCAQFSDWEALLERDTQSHGGYAIRLGFHLVNGLSSTGAQTFVARRRRQGGWQSWEHVLKDGGLARDDLGALAAANAFTIFGLDRKSALWRAEATPFSPNMREYEKMPLWEKESVFDQIQQDFVSTSTSLGKHPTEVIREQYWCFNVPLNQVRRSTELLRQQEGAWVTVFGMVIVRQSPPTAKGVVFVSLEDSMGTVNLIFHPQVFRRFHALVDGQSFLCVQGRLQAYPEMRSVLVTQVMSPYQTKAKVVGFVKQSVRKLEEESWAAVRNYM